MLIYAGVDGTSSENDEEYKETFKNSFVNRLQRWFPDCPFYHRGPYTSGSTTATIARFAFDHVVENYSPGDSVFLAGYSRGGAAVIEVAHWLKYEKKIPVDCLILFDPVDRTTTLGDPLGIPGTDFDIPGWTDRPIVDTVKYAMYFQRNKWTSLSRISFGNCGYKKGNPNMRYFYKQYHATHGGLGGTPWKKSENPYNGLWHPTIWEFGELNATTITVGADSAGAEIVWKDAKNLIENAIEEVQNRNPTTPSPGRPSQPRPGVPGGGGGGPVPIPKLGPGDRWHIVQEGEWLSKIAGVYYGDIYKWEKIYDNEYNRSVIGDNPDLIEPKMQLLIPA